MSATFDAVHVIPVGRGRFLFCQPKTLDVAPFWTAVPHNVVRWCAERLGPAVARVRRKKRAESAQTAFYAHAPIAARRRPFGDSTEGTLKEVAGRAPGGVNLKLKREKSGGFEPP